MAGYALLGNLHLEIVQRLVSAIPTMINTTTKTKKTPLDLLIKQDQQELAIRNTATTNQSTKSGNNSGCPASFTGAKT